MSLANKIQKKTEVLFIGSFIDENKKKERGGMLSDCACLVNSRILENVEFNTFDTSNETVPIPPLRKRLLSAAKRLFNYLNILFFKRPDVVLIYSSGGLSFLEKGLLAILAKVFYLPVIWSVRSGVFMDQTRGSSLFLRTARLLLRAPDIILCQGNSWADFYQKELRINPSSLRVIPNWIDSTRFFAVSEREVRHISKSPFRLLFVGWVSKAKGISELLEAMIEIHSDIQIRLDIVGKGEYFDRALQQVREKPELHDKIIFHEWLSGDLLITRFKEADALVLPTYAEGFPNVILEAMSAALPIITTPVGSISDVIEDGRNGILIKPRSSGELKEAIIRLYNNPQLCMEMGQLNKTQVRENHQIDKLSMELWKIIQTILKK